MIAQAGSDPMPWSTVVLLVVILLGTAVVMMWIGWRASRGTLRRNAFAGIRTPSTMASDAAWEAAHRAGGRQITQAGVVSLIVGLLLLLRPSNTVGMILLGIWFVAVMAAAIVSTLRGNRAARAVAD